MKISEFFVFVGVLFAISVAGFPGIYSDILILTGFSVVLVSLSVAFFKGRI